MEMVALNVCQIILRSQVTVRHDNKPPKYSHAGLVSVISIGFSRKRTSASKTQCNLW